MNKSNSRAVAILNACARHGIADEAHSFIRSDLEIHEVERALAEHAEERRHASVRGLLTMSDREARRYSLVRAIQAQASGDWRKAGLEQEVSDAIAAKMPSEYQRRGGFFMPTNIPHGVGSRTALSAGGSGTGADLIFTQRGSFIDLLRNRALVARLGAEIVSDLQGPVEFPKQLTAGSIQWLGEAGQGTESNLTTGRVPLAPKTIRARQSYSKQLLRQGDAIEEFVRADLFATAMLGIDRAAIAGAGGDEPLGVLGTEGIGLVEIGEDGGALTYGHAVDLEAAIDVANAPDAMTRAFLTTPAVRAKFRKIAELGNTIALPAWRGGALDGELVGSPAYTSNQVPSNLVKGDSTDCHALMYGDWSQLLIGEFGVMEIDADRYSRGDYGEIIVRVFHMVGVAIRNPEAFAVITDARPQL
jgi:HK97 family phage major capsid protein